MAWSAWVDRCSFLTNVFCLKTNISFGENRSWLCIDCQRAIYSLHADGWVGTGGWMHFSSCTIMTLDRLSCVSVRHRHYILGSSRINLKFIRLRCQQSCLVSRRPLSLIKKTHFKQSLTNTVFAFSWCYSIWFYLVFYPLRFVDVCVGKFDGEITP